MVLAPMKSDNKSYFNKKNNRFACFYLCNVKVCLYMNKKLTLLLLSYHQKVFVAGIVFLCQLVSFVSKLFFYSLCYIFFLFPFCTKLGCTNFQVFICFNVLLWFFPYPKTYFSPCCIKACNKAVAKEHPFRCSFPIALCNLSTVVLYV